MNDTQVNSRQIKILQYLWTKPTTTRKDIESVFPQGSVSRITLIRDLNNLIEKGMIQQSGGGKYIKYSLVPDKEILVPININEYFQSPIDTRYVRYPSFNNGVIIKLNNLFSSDELRIFEQGRKQLQSRFETVDPSIIKRELERFTIEFSWKSSRIEGNTYSLLETEELIKNKKEAIEFLNSYKWSSYLDYLEIVRQENKIFDRVNFLNYFKTKRDFQKEIFEWINIKTDNDV